MNDEPDAAFPQTARNTLKRYPQRASYERETIYSILDEGLICHLAFADEQDQPYVIPTAYARLDDRLYLHGSAASRTLRAARSEITVSVCVTLTDGIVLARTAFNHSFNYRSVVVFGTASAVEDHDEKLLALSRFTNQLVPGRWDDVRKPTPAELKSTSVLALPLTEASAKIRTGPPGDAGDELDYPTWAGVIPLEYRALAPIPDPKLPSTVAVPPYAADYRRSPVRRNRAEEES